MVVGCALGNQELWQSVCNDDQCTKDEKAFLVNFAARVLLFNACGLDRRVCSPFKEFPYRLFLLVKKPKDENCDLRKNIASEILGRKDADLEINTRKIKRRFLSELEVAKLKGTLPSRLFWLIKGISFLFKSDVRENERINKMLSLLDERAPSATTELKSSRISLKFLLGEAGLGTGRSHAKWSTFRPVAQEVREECMSGWPSLLEVQCDPTRWSPSKAAPHCLPAQKILSLQGQLKPHLKCSSIQHAWAASYNVYVHKALDDVSSGLKINPMFPLVFCVAVRETGESKSRFKFWVSCETVRRKHIVFPAEYEHDSSRSVISWAKLEGFRPLLHVIKDEFATVRAGHSVCLMLSAVTSLGDAATGNTSCAVLGKPKALVKFEAPTASFIDKCTSAQVSPPPEAEAEGRKPPSIRATKSSATHVPAQEEGLLLLAEEAEMEAQRQTCEADDDTLFEDGCAEEDFHIHVARGLASDCCPSVYTSEDLLEEEAAARLRAQSGEGLMNQHEHALALDAILNKSSDIDSSQQRAVLQSIAENAALDLDPVEAVVEAVVAERAGVDPPGASGSSSSVLTILMLDARFPKA